MGLCNTIEKRAILPSKDITADLAEKMVEMDICEVPHDSLLSIAVSAIAGVDPSSFYEPHDTIANELSSLSEEYKEVTMHGVPLDQVDGLHESLCSMATLMKQRLLKVGFDPKDEDGFVNCSNFVEMTDAGDIVIGFEE